jgi:uncharacterized protein involved in tolerance to divalent cations
MFKLFKKKKKEKDIIFHPETQFVDEIEEALWEIKDEYDLPTEEVINVVESKRRNLDYMHRILKEKNRRT